jgi:hypothetical protein
MAAAWASPQFLLVLGRLRDLITMSSAAKETNKNDKNKQQTGRYFPNFTYHPLFLGTGIP